MSRSAPWRVLAAAAFALSLSAAVAMLVFRYQALRRLEMDQQRLTYSYHLEKELEDIISVFRGAEFYERTYLLTKTPSSLQNFQRAVAQLPSEVEDVRALLLTDDVRLATLNRTETAMNARTQMLADEAQAGTPEAIWLSPVVRDADIVGPIQLMIDAEAATMDLRRENIFNDVAHSFVDVIVLSAVALLTIGALITWLVLDLRRRVRVERELREARDLADAANRAKSMFIANISHEIRTPMNAIVGFGELLLDQSSGGDRALYADTVRRNCKHLMQIIDDLLDVAKGEAGKLQIEMQRCALRDIIADVTLPLGRQAAERGSQLLVTEDGPLPDWITTDPVRLRQVLLNIVGNAVKFTRRGRVELLTRAPLPGVIEFLVKDTGPGIAVEHQKELFKPFSQADASTRRLFGGTGLGLALARQLARALGGDVELMTSALGRGSTFVIRIAYDPTARPGVEPPAVVSEQVLDFSHRGGEHALAGMRILVAEDAVDNRLLLTQILRKRGAVVDLATNGREAVERAMETEYDAVLMDLQMPERDGFQATEDLRRAGFQKPIIAVSAAVMMEERERSRAAGCTAHVGKPINVRELVQALLN